jgi:hypothetical protein
MRIKGTSLFVREVRKLVVEGRTAFSSNTKRRKG